ncbi:MAG: protein kinase domain-containing protein [Thermoanaerobaculia bacterium]
MTALPDRDDQVMSVITVALSLRSDERSAYLRAATEGDEDLFRETRDAIEWEDRMGGFLRRPWLSLQDLERPFRPGQLINDRFEIVREIGQGGMGIVYEALDHKRGQRIAVKSAKLGFRRLLSPELESALRVRHPNVCLVNEIHTASTDYGDVDFLTMELLDGPTLQEVLSARGPLPPREAMEIALQLCAGVAEAHRIGVVHKDLKTANVVLAKTPDGKARAVITDFGIAGEPAADGGDLAGTPRYMAPELWRGAAASKVSDVYALGVILYEMVTGATPFGDAPSEVRLTGRPPNVVTRSPQFGRRLDAVMARCLDPSPDARPRDAAELLDALTPRPSRGAAWIGAVAVLALVAGIALREPVSRLLDPPNVRLAMLPPEAAGNAATIADGALSDVADRLARRGGSPTLVIIRPARVVAGDAHTPEEARRNLDATHALQLTLRQEGGDLVARAAVIDLATHIALEKLSGRYPAAHAGDLPVALTGAVSKALRLRGHAEEPISPAAATPYVRGLSHLRRDQHGFDLALPLFREAMRLDPRAPQPRAGAVEALVLKHNDRKDTRWLAEAERELAAAQAIDPDSVAVLLAAGRLDVARGRYEQALNTYQRIAERQPRNIEVLLRIAQVNDLLNLRDEAVESYERAIALDPGYYETYQELGAFYFNRGDYAQAEKQFRNVIARAPRFHNAWVNLGGALTDMGRYDEAVRALETALSIKPTARAFNNLAAARAYQKRDVEAIDLYKKAFALDPRNHMYLMNLGDSSRRAGRAADSRHYYSAAMAAAVRDLQDNPRDGRTRAYVGYLAARVGDSSRGEQEIEQALQLAPTDKVVVRRAVVTYEMLGRRVRALAIAETASRDVLRELDRHPDLADFRDDPRFRELKAKREKGG